jgi:hypothetical protein
MRSALVSKYLIKFSFLGGLGVLGGSIIVLVSLRVSAVQYLIWISFVSFVSFVSELLSL